MAWRKYKNLVSHMKCNIGPLLYQAQIRDTQQIHWTVLFNKKLERPIENVERVKMLPIY